MKTIETTIARILEAEEISLASKPNFVQFESTETVRKLLTKGSQFSQIEYGITKIEIDLESFLPAVLEQGGRISIRNERTQKEEIITATNDVVKVNASTFYYNEAELQTTTENFRQTLLKIPFLRAHFHVYVVYQNGQRTSKIVIESKKEDIKPLIEIAMGQIIKLSTTTPNITPDSIVMGLKKPENVTIILDIYKNADIRLGETETVEYTSLGEYIVSLSKAYNREAIWFDLNSLWKNQSQYKDDFLKAQSWCDAGTLSQFRYTARRCDGIVNEVFHLSQPLYVLSGYERALGEITEYEEDLDYSISERYVLDLETKNRMKPLSKNTYNSHILGQSQYFNFILAHSNKQNKIGLEYLAKTNTGMFISSTIKHEMPANQFHTVNTIKLEVGSIN